ncbi:MAG: hypothetical protein AAGJ31_01445 [Verrucomicrobiota bacterium]
MPFFLRWPEKIPAGTQSNHLLAFADVFANFAELAGQPNLPDSTAENSVIFAPILFDPGGDHPRRAPILHGEKVIRDGDWKLLNTKESRLCTADPNLKYDIALYNLQKDLEEKINFANSMPEEVEERQGKIRSLLGDKP